MLLQKVLEIGHESAKNHFVLDLPILNNVNKIRLNSFLGFDKIRP